VKLPKYLVIFLREIVKGKKKTLSYSEKV